tara:strand:- start:780 stop:959 length:180 start_codon:yes stop_codon:yes gene_type:complete
MAKGKMPPQLLEYFKKKVANGSEDKEQSDSSKRAEALSKAKAKLEEKNANSRTKKETTS